MTKEGLICCFMIMFLVSSCVSNDTTKKVDTLSNQAEKDSTQFLLTSIEQVPVIDEDGYWLFGINMNNLTDSDISVDMTSNVLIYYKDKNDWYQTVNHEVVYENEWVIASYPEEFSTRFFLIRPSLRREDMTIRIFVIGRSLSEKDKTYTGMIEYIIMDGNLAKINQIDYFNITE